MSSTPLTCCSIGSATVFTRVLALAPGYRVVTWMVGGTTFGYWAVGNPKSETSPIRTMTNARTLASTGRSMKKREIIFVPRDGSFRRRFGRARPRALWRIVRGRRQLGSLRFDLVARKGPLRAFGHDPIAGIEPGFNDTKLPLLLSEFDGLAPNDVVCADHEHVAAFLAGPDRIVARQ